MRSEPGIPRIAFDRSKYGRTLLADACRIRDIPGFITEPRSHRLGFYEVAIISEGRGVLELDHATVSIAPQRVVVTAPEEARRWRLEGNGLDGFVVFFEADFVEQAMGLRQITERIPLLSAAPEQRAFSIHAPRFHELNGIARCMRDELDAPANDTDLALRAETCRLLVSLQRAAGPLTPAMIQRDAGSRGQRRELARRYSTLVDEHFTREHRVSSYARMLHVSARHLGSCVQESTGSTPSEVLHRRQFLEARRLLVHSRLGVGAIAEHLGFAECSYFIRFFRRHAGTTPLAFRARHESDISLPMSALATAMS
jgi:AraC family transcriptional regulator, transcriptional activator of pobA